MNQFIFERAQSSPKALAVTEDDDQLTYEELVFESQKMAQTLLSMGIGLEEPVGIFLAPGINLVIAQLAVILSRATCVAVDPAMPKMRLTDMFRDVKVKYVIIADQKDHLLEDMGYVLISSDRKGSVHRQLTGDKDITALDIVLDIQHRTHILFTSGSTGKPKPVQVSAQSINHLASKTPFTPLHPDDKVAHFNNPGFDLSLFEIWATLLSGATIVSINKQLVTDPSLLKAYLESQGVTVMMLSVALMEILVFEEPSIFQSLRHVLSAGDVASVKAMRTLCKPPEYLWNTYGPTECTTLASALLVTDEELERDRISIGRAVGDMEIYLLDQSLHLIRESGIRGEICISGPQLSEGYLNLPKETEERFVHVERCVLDGSEPPSQSVRLYRTGDYAEWRPDSDCLEFLGRLDRQVKHGGFRIELPEVERLLRSHEAAESAAVIHIASTANNGIPLLVAFVKINRQQDLSVEALSKFVRERSPSYMVPNHIELLDDLPLTMNGKLDRQALKDRYETRKKSQTTTDTTSERSISNRGPTKKSIIKELWKEILPQSHASEQDDFIQQGATSLQNAALISSIRKRLDCRISMDQFQQHTQLQDLVSLVEEMTSTTEPFAYSADETEIWSRDVGIVDDIELTPDWTADAEGRVFLTGATGFVGANLLRHLLEMPTVKHVACLVRQQGSTSGADRIQQTLERYDLWPESLTLLQKIMVLEGDMEEPNLGLSVEQFAWLTNWASVVFHLGAKVNFCESYAAHYASNVLGTKHVLRVAALGRRKSFHYMSSIDVWGPTGFILGNRRVLEDESLFPHTQALRYDLGYSASQWTAEQMVRRMRERGLPVTIYRPGYIIGDSRTGALNPNDFFSRLIVGCIHIGAFPDLQQNLEYCTIDYVISAMIHIASSNRHLGRSYSLLSPDPSASITVKETCQVINDAGYAVRLVKYSQWVREVISGQLPDGPLAPLMPMFEERVLGELTRWEASQNTPIYDSTNAAEALQDRPDIRYKPLDPVLLQSIISFWKRKGFYQV
ncbi:NRPS-like protein biosynthetic cluster [Penicillium nucicola]|uniref:NRPS-like protein biosynthetic cluster n=1 Tax=Penicillium nucicola TaxID=1850975 RepID=UPI002544E35A|nr:NRPS-like protein biosynthetic cluster [Penicillium nucicola]KAJ5776442.1 NRPS-like protein biosynthetic cluster [Penicillium nucicola]